MFWRMGDGGGKRHCCLEHDRRDAGKIFARGRDQRSLASTRCVAFFKAGTQSRNGLKNNGPKIACSLVSHVTIPNPSR
jgi:hypothetical protein